MTDKKFTDEEIIKALECHINAEDCVGCEMFDWCDEIILTELVLDLINRQKAEIERLKSQCENTQIGYNFLKSDFEKLKGSTIVNNIMEIQRIKREAKAEAYKEFAERLCEGKVSNDKTVIEAKVLLKEMVGEE